jgi:endonuclease/exonuclease/phosphatase family metal-dependent hydrolase
MKTFIHGALAAALAALLIGCSSAKEVKKEELPPPPAPVAKKPGEPDLIVKVASINLANLGKRIEADDIDKIDAALKKGKIDIVTLQGVSRYPNVATRIDIVDSLALRLEMRHVFGETIQLSGRQNGNAVFSAYPIKSDENSHYEGIRSDKFEAALQAVVDCGVRDVVVVSTGIPDPLTEEDRRTIANKMSSFGIQYLSEPLIITGNLPTPEELRTSSQYATLKPMSFEGAPRIWFSAGGALKLLGQSITITPLGPMTVAEFGLFRAPQP